MARPSVAAVPHPDSPGEIRDLEIPSRLWVPCESEPLPAGTTLRRGQPLSLDGMQSPAPAGGTIAGVCRMRLIGSRETQAVVLETIPGEPHSAEPVTDAEAIKNALEKLAGTDLKSQLEAITNAGIAANRWTSPDLLGQLRLLTEKPAKLVLCAALDLDPALPLGRTLAESHAMDIAAGAAALAKLAGAGKVVLAVAEDLPPASIAALRAAALATGVRLYPLPNQYPLAHPSLLIRRITGIKSPPDVLPAARGVLMLDAASALAAGRWFVHGEPMLRVPLGVYDRLRNNGNLLWAAVGMKLADALAAAGIPGDTCDLHAGHILREVTVCSDAIVGAGELTLFASESAWARQAAACLRCGWCVESCPVRIHPAGLLEAAQQNDPHLADRNGLRSCIECGICSYVCPSRLPLLPSIRTLRHER